MTTTRAQREAMGRLYMRTVTTVPPEKSYLQWRHAVQHNGLMGCLMVQFCGMWCGIEKDGYTHS